MPKHARMLNVTASFTRSARVTVQIKDKNGKWVDQDNPTVINAQVGAAVESITSQRRIVIEEVDAPADPEQG
jgi:hypothetical protein